MNRLCLHKDGPLKRHPRLGGRSRIRPRLGIKQACIVLDRELRVHREPTGAVSRSARHPHRKVHRLPAARHDPHLGAVLRWREDVGEDGGELRLAEGAAGLHVCEDALEVPDALGHRTHLAQPRLHEAELLVHGPEARRKALGERAIELFLNRRTHLLEAGLVACAHLLKAGVHARADLGELGLELGAERFARRCIRLDDLREARVHQPLQLKELAVHHLARLGKRLSGRLVERTHLGRAPVLLLGEVAGQPRQRLRDAALDVEDRLLHLLALAPHPREDRLNHLVLLVAPQVLRSLDLQKAHFEHEPDHSGGEKGAQARKYQKKRVGRHVGIRKKCRGARPVRNAILAEPAKRLMPRTTRAENAKRPPPPEGGRGPESSP